MNKKYLLKKRFEKGKSRHYLNLILCQCGALFKRRSNEKRKITCTRCKETPVSFDAMIPLKSIYNKYQASAWVREFSFNLDLPSFIQLVLSPCTYCGAGLSNRFRHRKGILEYNGIDRQNNDQGYQVTNCVSCCKTCNVAKLDKTVDEFIFWARKVVENGKRLK